MSFYPESAMSPTRGTATFVVHVNHHGEVVMYPLVDGKPGDFATGTMPEVLGSIVAKSVVNRIAQVFAPGYDGLLDVEDPRCWRLLPCFGRERWLWGGVAGVLNQGGKRAGEMYHATYICFLLNLPIYEYVGWDEKTRKWIVEPKGQDHDAMVLAGET